MIAAIDKKLSEQINLIMHHADFQKLEGAWRGLHYLVNNTETDEQLKIRVMNISKAELGKTLKRYKGTATGTRARSSRRSTRKSSASSVASPSAAWWATTTSTTARPTSNCWRDGQGRGRGHCPFIAGASPTLMQMDSWQELANPRDLTKIFTTPEYAAWRSLRESTTPSTSAWPCRASWRACPMAPRPTRSKSSTSKKTPAAADHGKYTWANAAYAMATNINRSFKEYGWCSRIRGIESGGAVRTCRCTASPPTTAVWT
jgi:type VI secretion system protein ImpC